MSHFATMSRMHVEGGTPGKLYRELYGNLKDYFTLEVR